MLGIVLAPYGKVPGSWPTGVANAFSSVRGGFLCPEDPTFNERGEAGQFYDTYLGGLGRPRLRKLNWLQRRRLRKQLLGLGAIPTDAELSIVRGYTPVESGWIPSSAGYITPTWLPPAGYSQGGYPPPIALNGLGADGSPATDTLLSATNAHNDRVFSLMLVSTTAVALSALITVFRTLRLIKAEGK